MGDNRPRAGSRAHPEAGELVVHAHRRHLTASKVGFVSRRNKGTPRDADGRDAGDGAEVHGEAGVPGMVEAGRVDEEHLGDRVEREDCRCEHRAFPPGEHGRLVGGRHLLLGHLLREDVVGSTGLCAGGHAS
jgi:hypothetical protein